MTRQLDSAWSKIKGHLARIALNVEEKVGNARKGKELEKMPLCLSVKTKIYSFIPASLCERGLSNAGR